MRVQCSVAIKKSKKLLIKCCLISDTKTVSESGLRNGGKVFLVVKKDEPVKRPSFWDELYVVLKKHFKEPDCTMVLEQMKKVWTL